MIRASLTRKKRFWFEHRTELPLYYQTYVPEVGSQKASSSNVESVFSGVGGMVQKATILGAALTENYTQSATTTGCTSSSSRATKRSSQPTSSSTALSRTTRVGRRGKSSGSDEESDDADADEGKAGDSMQTE